MPNKVWTRILGLDKEPSYDSSLSVHSYRAQQWETCALSDFIDLRAEFPDLWAKKILIRNSHICEHFGKYIQDLGGKFYIAVLNNEPKVARHLYVVIGQAFKARSKEVSA